jgi:hypothetical protein
LNNNDKLKNIAIKVLEKSTIPKNANYSFDPLTILMIISVILTLIRILQECHKNKLNSDFTIENKYILYGTEIRGLSLRRGWFTKMRIKKILRKEMKKEDYEKYSLSIINALLDKGETLTEDELKILLEVANV